MHETAFGHDLPAVGGQLMPPVTISQITSDHDMSHAVDFVTVSTIGLESSPVAAALAGLRANEARYFSVVPAAEAERIIGWVHRILEAERNIVVASPPLEATSFQVEDIRWTYVFYENGLSINVLLEPKKRAVGFKLSEGMEVPELGSFKFARQKSKLAGTIRGSYFVVKGEWSDPEGDDPQRVS